MAHDLIWDYLQTNVPEGFEGSRARNALVLQYVTDLIRPPGAKLLNVGVGVGLLEESAMRAGFEVYSLDPSEGSIELLRQRMEIGGRAQPGFAQSMPFADSTFDAVVMSEVLEHLTDEVLSSTLREVTRVLRPGGIFAGTVPARENLAESVVICPHCGERFHRWGHHQSFDPARLQALLSASLRVIRIDERPIVNWATLNWKGKSIALTKLGLRGLGQHGRGENLVFVAVKPES